MNLAWKLGARSPGHRRLAAGHHRREPGRRAGDRGGPSTIFAAYNHYAGDKDIAVYEFNGHEGGGTRHLLAKLDFLARQLG